MRNLKQYIPGRYADPYQDAKASGCGSQGMCTGREYAELIIRRVTMMDGNRQGKMGEIPVLFLLKSLLFSYILTGSLLLLLALLLY